MDPQALPQQSIFVWRRLLDEGQDPPIDEGVRESIDAYVDRRTAEVGASG